MVGELAGDDVGRQAGARQTLLDRLGETRGDGDVRGAAAAGVLRPDVLDDDQAGGEVLE